MTAMVLPVQNRFGNGKPTEQTMQVSVHLQATVMAPEMALHKANVWLSMNAGHLLLAEDPELLLADPLQWRFPITRSVPRRDKPGAVHKRAIGHMQMNATTGEILNPDPLIQELTANADALAQPSA